jgi:hypothetical protein
MEAMYHATSLFSIVSVRAFFFVMLRSVVAEKAQVRMDGALTVVDKLSWVRCGVSRACALE